MQIDSELYKVQITFQWLNRAFIDSSFEGMRKQGKLLENFVFGGEIHEFTVIINVNVVVIERRDS